jgi:putative heme-binding domain-containing protein
MLTTLALAALLPAATPLPKAPDGFKVELVLEAPAIEAPTALAVAANGDVYFAEDPMDMFGPPTKNIDRIWLLKGGDPTKKILFADKMWAVMGLEIVGDKMYCVHAPYVSVFTLNSDGTAKERTDLFTDLGPPVAGVPGFNDHIPSGIRMGMDGYLYVSIGDKGIPKMARKETDRGSVHVAEGRWRHTKEGHHISLEGGGVIRFRPDGSNLEVFASGTRNHLDVPMDEHDRIFVRDNTDDGNGWNTRLMYLPRGGFMGYPWAYTKRPAETLPMIHDFGGGSPCGGWVYCDDGLPETYRGRIFHCEWGQGKVYAVKVAPDGAGFKYVDQINFLDPAGTELKDFRPFTLRPTADGRGFYVTDWGFSGWMQPKKAGRIFKVTYTRDDVKPAPRGKDTDSVEQLIAALGHSAHSERLRAQRALIARGPEVALHVDLDLRSGVPHSDNTLIGELWVLAAIGPERMFKWLDTRFSDRLSPDVRMEVFRILSDDRVRRLAKTTRVSRGSYFNNMYDHVFYQSAHYEPRVRLFAILADYQLEKRERLNVSDVSDGDPYLRGALMRVEKNNSLLGHCESLGSDLSWLLGPTDPFSDLLLMYMNGEFRSIQFDFMTLNDRFDQPTIDLLQRKMRSKYWFIRRYAVLTLARNYKDRKPYAGTWWGTQPARNPPPKRDIEWEGTPLVRAAVIKALGDPAAEVRKAAVAALVEWADPETLSALRERFTAEKDAASRLDIVRAVAGMNAPDAADFLAGILRNRADPIDLRRKALAGLSHMKWSAGEDAIVAVAVLEEPADLHALALRTLGEMKSRRTRSACEGSLKSTRDGAIVASAMMALAKLGDPAAGTLVLPELAHANLAARKAAITAAGALRLRDAVPVLIRLSGVPDTEFEALTALAAIPDARALSAYLTGLTSKNADLRAASRLALGQVRDQVAPALAELAKRNELPPPVVAELRTVYSVAVPITAWKLIGPFPGYAAVHPPETEQKFDALYDVAGKQLKWRDRTAEPKHGRVNLAKLLAQANDVAAYGFATIASDRDRDAKFTLGSDDTLTVWLNGAKVYDFPGQRAWLPEQATVDVKLTKGENRLLVKCGNVGAQWDFSVAVSDDPTQYTFLQGGPAKFDLDAFRAFARKTQGDSERGRKLFADVKGLACVKCHAVGGQGGAVGPDLAGIALKYQREDLMTSVLEPSKVIAQGYETINILTTSGKSMTGVFKGETADAVRLADADGKEQLVPKAEIDERAFSPVSLMPNGLSDGMTLQDFADLIAFLEARKEKK